MNDRCVCEFHLKHFIFFNSILFSRNLESCIPTCTCINTVFLFICSVLGAIMKYFYF